MSVPSLFTTSKIVLCREYTLLPFCKYIYIYLNILSARSVQENISPRSFTVQSVERSVRKTEGKYFPGQTVQTRSLRYLLHGFSFRSVKKNAARVIEPIFGQSACQIRLLALEI